MKSYALGTVTNREGSEKPFLNNLPSVHVIYYNLIINFKIMTTQSNPENKNQPKAGQTNPKTTEQKNSATKTPTNKEDGERSERQDKNKTTITPTSQPTSQNPQAKTASTPVATSTPQGKR